MKKMILLFAVMIGLVFTVGCQKKNGVQNTPTGTKCQAGKCGQGKCGGN